jgi:hypothetical protein
MSLTFPNRSRSYDEAVKRIRKSIYVLTAADFR